MGGRSVNVAAALRTWDCAQEVTGLCSDLIRRPSENPPGDVKQVADRVAELLTSIGFSVQWIPGPNGQPNLVAELSFGPGPTLLLNGHMDVVPAGDRSRWRFDPFGGQIRDGYVHGRGASDMKGGLAALLVALRWIREIPGLRGRVVFMAVSDEETGGIHGSRFLLDKGLSGDGCLIAEPSGHSPTIGQKGNIWLDAVTQGVSAHGSLSPWVGVNAVLRMCGMIDVIYRLREIDWPIDPAARDLIAHSQRLLRAEGHSAPAEALGRVSVNVGHICGGEKVNIVPGRCEAQFDLRVPIGVSTSRVLQRITEMLSDAGFDPDGVRPAAPPNEPNHTPPDHPLIEVLVTAIREITGKPSEPMLQWASSDARFFRYRSIPTAQYGPAELDGIHGFDERVSVKGLVDAARVYALFVHRFLHARTEQRRDCV